MFSTTITSVLGPRSSPTANWRAQSESVHEMNGIAITSLANEALRVASEGRTEKEGVLRGTEPRFRELLENVDLIAMTLDERGRITFCNDHLLGLTGWRREEVIGADWFETFIPDADNDTSKLYFDTIDSGSVPAHHENPIRTRTGQLRDVRWSNTILRDTAGRVVGTASIGEDVTDRRRAEVALVESEERFRQLAEHVTTVFWIVDPIAGTTLYISPAYETIWGRSRASREANPLGWLDAIHAEDRPRIEAVVVDRPVTEPYEHAYRILRPDGALRWIHESGFPVRNDAGQIHRVVGMAEDVTDHHLLQEQFHQAQKMQAVGTLAGGIAHDFNNVLAAIQGFTELARMSAAEGEVTEYLGAVLTSTGRAASLVRKILAFSQQQEMDRGPIQIAPIVEESLALLRAMLPSTIEFETSPALEVPSVLADASEVQQVMMNLCTNAAQAMGEQPGRLTVSLEGFVVDEPLAASHPALRQGLYARLSVADTGCGMDQATASRMFEPFFTTRVQGEGTGLGLAVVHGIMQNHEGVVTVDSRPGEGTTMRLYFPAHHDGSAEAEAVPHGQGERILFVDDEASLADMGKRILERLGYSVDARVSALEALDAVRAAPEAYDLVVTDYMMPRLTGTGFAQRLQGIRVDLPVILTTGYRASLTVEGVQAMGVRTLLSKPVSVRTLGTVVARVLADTKRR
jgi:PAS domain S-box-containing protein